MKTAIVAATVALVAIATPVRAQTLPFYPEVKAECSAFPCPVTREDMMQSWDSLDPKIRLFCLADKRITDYLSLSKCIERYAERGGITTSSPRR